MRVSAAAALVLRATIASAWVYALTHPSLPQLQDAATHARTIGWPIGLLAVPAVLRLVWRDRPYPWRVDALLALPFALDSAGNVLNLYHSWRLYDTMNHCFSWFDLAALASMTPAVRSLPTWARTAMTLGAGAFGAILWELGEFAAFLHSSYSRTSYSDTLTDLTAGLVGSAGAAAFVLLVIRRSGPEELAAAVVQTS